MANSKHTYWAIVPAAGIGKRMGSDIPKQYLKLHGKTIIEHTLQRLSQIELIEGIVVAIAKDDPWWPELNLDLTKPLNVVHGGTERCHTVQNGLYALKGKCTSDDWVLVHDAARPCVRIDDINMMIQSLNRHESGGLLGMPVRDTMKRTNQKNQVQKTVDRDNLWHALTPQMFRYGLLNQALEQALNDQFLVTDEASAMEHAGFSPLMLEGHGDNIKITRPEDLALADFYLQYQSESQMDVATEGLDDGG
ncbi:MAG: 2-C-methyl-D-erythritol 4-phosphate cytidylyltransferase [Gammaproteobacteria bacterium]|nr:2-C-methyl-D-erythritol 4-phosphate cytidylyltransferase [Gammaproteobacteria bacterium]